MCKMRNFTLSVPGWAGAGAGGPLRPAQSPPRSPTLPDAPTPAGRFTVRMGVVARAGGRAGSAPTVTPLPPRAARSGGEGANEPQEEAEKGRGSPLVKADIKNINLPSPIPPPSRGFTPTPTPGLRHEAVRPGGTAAKAAMLPLLLQLSRRGVPARGCRRRPLGSTGWGGHATATTRRAGKRRSRLGRNGRWSGRRVRRPGELPGSAPRPPCPG